MRKIHQWIAGILTVVLVASFLPVLSESASAAEPETQTIEVNNLEDFTGALLTIKSDPSKLYTISLKDNITLEVSTTWTLDAAANVTILGNNHSITVPNEGIGLTVKNKDAVLTLGKADGTDTLTIQAAQGAKTKSALVIVDANNGQGGTLNMYDGVKISGNNAEGTGSKMAGGVAIVGTAGNSECTANDQLATFNMYGGTISGNTFTATATDYGGGGVRVEGPYRPHKEFLNQLIVFNMYGGTIQNNTVAADGSKKHSCSGGGIFVEWATFNMTGGTIDNNLAKGSQIHGGGIYTQYSNVSIDGGASKSCIIQNNNVQNTGTTSPAGGAGVYISGDYYYDGKGSVKNAQILKNGTSSHGGGTNPYVDGAGLDISVPSATIENCIFKDNRAGKDEKDPGRGSAIFFSTAGSTQSSGTAGTIKNCQIEGNSNGSAVAVYGSNGDSVTISDCQIVKNTGSTTVGKNSHYNGGGLLVDSLSSVSLSVTNTTITGNTAGYGGGIYIAQPRSATYTHSVTVQENCVLANNNSISGGGRGADVYCGDDGKGTTTVNLPDAASMGGEEGLIYLKDGQGQKIDGWYSEKSGSYTPKTNVQPVALPLHAGDAVVASYHLATFDITQSLTNVTSSWRGTTISQGNRFNPTLTPAKGYVLLPEDVTVKMNEKVVENVITKQEDGTVKINVPYTSGNIVLTAIAREDKNSNGVPDETEGKFSVSYTQGELPEGVNANGLPPQVTDILSGSTQQISEAKPTATGYVFDGWSVAPDTVTIAEDGTFTMPAENVTFTATWKDDKNGNGEADETETKYVISYVQGNLPEGVSASGMPEEVMDILSGSTQQISEAKPTATGYVFDGWSVAPDSVTIAGDGTFTMPAENVTFTAMWKTASGGGTTPGSKQYVITATADEGGSIMPHTTVYVNSGDDETFTITPDAGYKIADVLVDNVSVGAVSSYTFENVRASHTIHAVFEAVSDQPSTPGIADPDDTGVSDLLNTTDHDVYLNGYPDQTFGPSRNMTRAEVAAMFSNLLLDKDVAITTSFSDVNADAWYADAVNMLASLNVVKGYEDGTFRPNAPITRAEFTAIAMRFTKSVPEGANIFSDVHPGSWYYDTVVGSIQYGWIGGYEDGTFRPDNTVTRAEVTAITNRMLGRFADEAFIQSHASDLRAFVDLNDGHWAYYTIMEATNAHDYNKADGQEDWMALQ